YQTAGCHWRIPVVWANAFFILAACLSFRARRIACERETTSKQARSPPAPRETTLALLERLPLLPPQHRRRNLQPQDFVRPLVDAAHAHILQVPARPVQRGPAAAA